ncbi:MAG: SDR family NAD(P)-dependent oxidoreductase [Actinomycetota bacterium]|nr:SDR family NAD(P)-dependent oxidoreductase [Actinomycetota bacterium]
MSKTAVITGASAGIGAATAVRLSREGFDVVLGARRLDRLREVAAASGGTAHALDVSDPASVEEFCSHVGEVDVLVNNAGMAAGLTPISELSDEAADRMWSINVMGVLRMTRALLPKIEASDAGHVVNVGSIAGFETYRGGGGYTASKHALRAITQTLRLELLGGPVRVSEISPGLVETEFSLVRFGGDEVKARQPYAGIEPLTAEDIADCIAWAVTRPPHVDVDEIVVRPVAQARATEVARRTSETQPSGS